jgi:hypothetical protein
MRSPEFLRRAQKAVDRAVADLEAKGFKPVYDRDTIASDVKKQKIRPSSGSIVLIWSHSGCNATLW